MLRQPPQNDSHSNSYLSSNEARGQLNYIRLAIDSHSAFSALGQIVDEDSSNHKNKLGSHGDGGLFKKYKGQEKEGKGKDIKPDWTEGFDAILMMERLNDTGHERLRVFFLIFDR